MACYRRLSIIFVAFALLQSPASAGTDTLFVTKFFDYIYANFRLLPDYHFDSDLYTFLLHKNSYFKTRYFLANNTDLEFVFISYKWINSIWDFQYQIGMGQTPGNVVFDPMDINFGILPIIEIRAPDVNIQLGLDHHCFHEIDRCDLPTIYYNKPYAGIGSKNMRLYNFWSNLCGKAMPLFKDRFSWYGRFGWYVREFFGLIDADKVNGVNPYIWDLFGDFRYLFYTRKDWLVCARSSTTYGRYSSVRDNPAGIGGYFRQDIGIESYFRRGVRGGMIFATYTLDHLPLYPNIGSTELVPRLSNDRLLKVGLRFFL